MIGDGNESTGMVVASELPEKYSKFGYDDNEGGKGTDGCVYARIVKLTLTEPAVLVNKSDSGASIETVLKILPNNTSTPGDKGEHMESIQRIG